MTPLAAALERGPIVLDGGLGTLLEASGHDLSSSLWSARLLDDDPHAILDAHRSYFAAGARVGISASYQVSFDASGDRAPHLLRRSVELCAAARDEAVAVDGVERWVAASVGPYGAMLADGSEYRGDYGVDVGRLRSWHARRLDVLCDTDADVLAVETIPSLDEVGAIAAELMGRGRSAWISVTAAGGRLRSGESLAEAFRIAAAVPEVVAVGVNCTDPAEVAVAIGAARSVTSKPVVVYPNSGEHWDATARTWTGRAGFPAALVAEWVAAGAALVGGCCRVGPAEIESIVGACD